MEGLFSSGFGILIYFAFLFGIMWFILIRPQRKRDKQMKDLQSSIKVGDQVLTNTGMYGKIVDIVNDLFVVEFGLNKSINIPISKSAVISVQEPNLSITKDTPVIEENSEDTKKKDKKSKKDKKIK